MAPRPPLRKRRWEASVAILAAFWVCGPASVGRAAEPEDEALEAEPTGLHLGGAFGWAVLDNPAAQGEPAHQGFGGAITLRYGLTDAFDLTFAADLQGFPSKGALATGAEVGLTYVIDIMRWIPHVGVDVGFVDVVTLACPDDPTLCSHAPHPAIGIPAGFEFRIVPEAIVGVRFRYALFFVEPVGSQLFLGAYAAFAP